MTQEFIDYASPLIQGEVKSTYHNGLPKYFDPTRLELMEETHV